MVVLNKNNMNTFTYTIKQQPYSTVRGENNVVFRYLTAEDYTCYSSILFTTTKHIKHVYTYVLVECININFQGKYLARFLIHCKKRDILRARFLHLASFLQDSCYLLRIVREM